MRNSDSWNGGTKAWAELRGAQASKEVVPEILRRTGVGHWYADMDSAVGRVCIAYGPRGVFAVRQAMDRAEFEGWIFSRFGVTVRGEAALPTELESQMRTQMGGGSSNLSVDLRSVGKFGRAVLAVTTSIPFGEVRSYAWVAREAGAPGAVRAAGSALAKNPVPLAIPCHRVVRSDWHIGEYGCGGPSAKNAALRAEGVDLNLVNELARSRVRFQGVGGTRVFCVPTCRRLRDAAPGDRENFCSEGQARAAGFAPCLACRPVPVAQH